MKKLFRKNEAEVTEEAVVEPAVEEKAAEVEGEPKEKWYKRISKKTYIIAASIVACLLVVYVGLGIFFQSHFYFRSTVNGVPSSAATPDKVQQALVEASKGYELTLVEAGGKKEELKAEDLGLRITIKEATIQDLLLDQNGFLWVSNLFQPVNYQSEDLVSCDRDVIAKKVKTLDCIKDKNPIETKNANVTYKNDEFVIVDEVYGTQLEEKTLVNRIAKAAINLQDTLDLKEDKVYVQPKYTADSKEVKKLQKTLDQYMNTTITYTVGNEKEEIPAKTIGGWLSGDEKLQPVFDEAAMAEFIASMSKKYDTYGQPKTLATQYGTTVSVPGGNYGWRIDKDGELAQLKEDIASGKDVSRDFVYQYKAASRDGNDYGNSYVEINKTAQHLYLIMNGAVVLDTPVVTGKEDGEHYTPVGAYRITYCEAGATLRGPGYATKVGFWMPFNGDIGLHDATWQKSFGGQRYREGYGSHGCVNLPYSAAQTIFANVKTGFPVLMYDMPGTETIDSLTKQQAQSVMDAIGAIGGVTLDSGASIANARAAYEGLKDSGKSCVENYQALVDAENTYNTLVSQANQQAAAAAEAQAQAQAQADAKTVNDLINAINTAPDKKAAAEAAKAAYDKLSEAAKKYVTSYDLIEINLNPQS